MRNPEASKLPTIYGIKPENLTEEVVSEVRSVWTEVTGSEIHNPWIFHASRIKTEFSHGKDELSITLGTQRGAMTLSVKRNGGLFVFALDTLKGEKPVNLQLFYTNMEQQFDQRLSEILKKREVLELTVCF